jgi:hypothetical protein
MPPWDVGFEPAIPASERPQTYTLDRVATRTGRRYIQGDEIKVDKMGGALTYLGVSAYRVLVRKGEEGDDL